MEWKFGQASNVNKVKNVNNVKKVNNLNKVKNVNKVSWRVAGQILPQKVWASANIILALTHFIDLYYMKVPFQPFCGGAFSDTEV